MGKKVLSIIFIILFLLMIAVPLTATFFQHEEIAVEQNRMLVPPPQFLNEKGRINKTFTQNFEEWVNDHIGFRKEFVNQNGRVRYYLFHRFPIDRQTLLGPGGELNYANIDTIRDYQHKNLYPESYLQKTAESLETISDFAEENGAKFYYYQCWDKHSIYPEYFPKELLSYGEESKTDQVIKMFEETTDVSIISPKQELEDGKAEYETYSRWGDPTHWSPRGAITGYRKLMEALNEDAAEPCPVLMDEDYEISWTDQGLTLYETIHQKDLLEKFDIRDPKAKDTKEKLTLFADDRRSRFYTNPAAPNDSRLVIIGDSYFDYYIIDDIAESFHETIFFWGDHLTDLKEIVQEYGPDILVVENAEREDRTALLIEEAEKIKE